MVACTPAFGETRRIERLGGSERLWGYCCLHNSPLSSVLRVKRKQRVQRFKRCRLGLRRNTEDREARRHGEDASGMEKGLLQNPMFCGSLFLCNFLIIFSIFLEVNSFFPEDKGK